MSYFQDDFLGYRRKQWLRAIHEVQVLVGSTWYTGTINQKKIDGENLVIMATFPQLDTKAVTITASRIIDIRGEVAAYQARKIKKVSGQGCMINLKVPIYEVEVK